MPSSMMRVCERSSRSRSGNRARSIISASLIQLPRKFTDTMRPAESRSILPPSAVIQSVSTASSGIANRNSNIRFRMFSLHPGDPPVGIGRLVVIENPALGQCGAQGLVGFLRNGGVIEIQRLQCRNRLQDFGSPVGDIRVIETQLMEGQTLQ